MDEELKVYLETAFAAVHGKIDRFAEAVATEIGSLHTQIKLVEDRLVAQFEGIDARQRRDASLTTTLMELVVKQTRWHEQSDNAAAELAARRAEFSRKLDEFRGKAS